MAAEFDFFNFRGRRALVTGASSGLGRETALRLARQGADVVVAARRMDRLASLAEEIEALPKDGRIKPGQAKAVELDLAWRDNKIQAAIGEAWAAFGGIDILVNNAGTIESPLPSLAIPESEWDTVITVNIKGTALVLRAVANKMIEAGVGGTIVNVSSCSGVDRGVFDSQAMYSATKAAVSKLTRCLALELGPRGIRVNALCPGAFPSEMEPDFDNTWGAHAKTLPIPRPASTDPDITAPLLFLASDASAYMTGADLLVDGGLLLPLRPFPS